MLNAKRLTNLRKEKGLKQSEIANILNIQRTTYCKYETGGIQPPNDILIKIAKLFNVSSDYLLNLSNDPTPPNKKTPDEKPTDELKFDDLIISFYHGKDTKVSEKSKEKILDYVRLVLEDEEREKKSDN